MPRGKSEDKEPQEVTAQEPQNQPPVTLHQPGEPVVEREPDRTWRPEGNPPGPKPDPARAWRPEGRTPDVELGHGTVLESDKQVEDELAEIEGDEPEDLSPKKLAAIRDANVAAEKAIEADEKAREAADAAVDAWNQAEDIDAPKARRCPHCQERMTKHDNPDDPHKYGAWHCNNCGVCWRGNKLRPGELVPSDWVEEEADN